MKVTSATFALLSVVIAGCSGPSSVDIDASASSTDDAMLSQVQDAAPPSPDAAAEPKPSPKFSVGWTPSFVLPIDENGIRSSFESGGETFLAAVTLKLTAEGQQTSCEMVLAPSFKSFGFESNAARPFSTVHIDLSTSTILDNRCGWDESHVMTELANLGDGSIEIGFHPSSVTDYWHVVHARSWPMLGLGGTTTANVVLTSATTVLAMDGNGVVNDAVLVTEPEIDGVLPRGLYAD